MPGKKRLVEVKSYTDETKYYLVMSGHIECLLDLAHVIPIRSDLDRILQKALEGYMPVHSYDEAGSNVRIFANNYARLIHICKRSKSEEVEVFSREQISDILVNEGWELVGFSSHQGSIPTRMSVVERWMKTLSEAD